VAQALALNNGIPQGNGGDHDGDNNGGLSDGDPYQMSSLQRHIPSLSTERTRLEA
jgi:hypothetical protein